MFFIDGGVYPHKQLLTGRPGETGQVLTSATLWDDTPSDDIAPVGCGFPYGSTGIHPLGDGTFVFSVPCREGEKFATTLYRYRMDMETQDIFEVDE